MQVCFLFGWVFLITSRVFFINSDLLFFENKNIANVKNLQLNVLFNVKNLLPVYIKDQGLAEPRLSIISFFRCHNVIGIYQPTTQLGIHYDTNGSGCALCLRKDPESDISSIFPCKVRERGGQKIQ